MKPNPYLNELIKDLTSIALPLQLPSFGFFLWLAAILATLVLARELSRKQKQQLLPETRRTLLWRRPNDTTAVIPSELAIIAVLVTAVTAGLGAKLSFIIEGHSNVTLGSSANLWDRSGFSLAGTLWFGAAGLALCLRRLQISFLVVADAAAPAALICFAISRVGLWIGEGMVVHPVAGPLPLGLVEAVTASLGTAVLWALRDHRRQHGWLATLGVTWLATQIVITDYLRYASQDDPSSPLVNASFVSYLFLLALGIVGAWHQRQLRQSLDGFS